MLPFDKFSEKLQSKIDLLFILFCLIVNEINRYNFKYSLNNKLNDLKGIKVGL